MSEVAPQASNEDQIAYWNSEVGQKWTDGQEEIDRLLGPLGEAAMAAVGVRPGDHVIDVGCGCGATVLELARRVGPMGRVLGIDISTPMLRRAEARAEAEGLAHVVFLNTDAATYRFDAGAADLAYSRFGVMFFADPAAAFANIRKGLKAGGRLGFVAWRAMADNPWVTVARDVALRFVPPPEPVPEGAPGPFAFADGKRAAAALEAAGFREVAVEPFDTALRHDGMPAEIAEAMLRIGPASRLVAEADEETRANILEALAVEIATRHDGAGIDLAAAAWIVTARA